MGGLIGLIIKTTLGLLAGVGIGSLVDKVAADKVPQYEPVMPDIIPGRLGFKPIKLLTTVLFLALGAFVVAFIAKKGHIKILK